MFLEIGMSFAVFECIDLGLSASKETEVQTLKLRSAADGKGCAP